MSKYATTTSISLILPGFLVGNTTTSDTAGTAMFSEFIDQAESKVDAAVSNRYSLPLTTVPPLMRTLSKHVACYYAMRSTAYRGVRKNEFVDDFKDALKTLEALRSGNEALAYTDGSLVPRKSTTKMLSNTENYSPIFGLDDPENWQRDSDEVNDTANSRS